ncbi:MAG: TetR/AcrR family transcriptional regulator [Actinobacteria bacterium]|nr:TetR/AcrR family transcriptional regulator [Actinomycetota bacterium]
MEKKKLTKRGSKRREQILDASYRLFAEQGYHGTTVGDICDDLGVGKGVFYWYFKSKEALFRELLASTLWKLRRSQQEAIEKKSDPVERIEEGIRASIAFYRNEPGYLALIRTAARYDAFSGSLKEGQQIVVTDTALHIKEGMAAGSIRHGDPELMAHGILGAIFHFVEVYFGTESGATVDRPQLADEAVAFCLKGVLSP